ncbi:NADH-quinone oxidoreductase subunit NuoF [Heliorestis convoluta]|uniref:Ubiquinone oxidoreductase, NADH-binding (51 kD) subunit, chain F n=1 Tax=Heliorestis convoluta TaxID=356322 RepID=A0A5Q2N633_9FIRM|nr:NADH-quinone oxidoreductase subunit NuoF [Heliorestis convoluta]QGG49086.1 ubiquinone oxidoreductase, NADH-binding (51 kD) subunit, chain F [Heliorestis convoluta]
MDQRRILICAGTGCIASGAKKVEKAFQKALEERELHKTLEIVLTGCHGFCEQGPLVIIEPEKVFYCRVEEKDVQEIVESHLINQKIITPLLYQDALTGRNVETYEDINFYSKQERTVLRNCGRIDPEKIEDYVAQEGYKGLKKALSMTPRQVIDEIKRSELRGRGGGGFPTGLKWQLTAEAAGDEKYIICNADEGDPGAFMDRSVLEGDPHAVLEGMMIAGYAIGAQKGYVYVRAEYPLAIERLQKAIDQANAKRFLGAKTLQSTFNFTIEIKAGAGAFVCGEESALIASMEGQRGMPRKRPPYPSTQGLWGKPTNINNVETFANIPAILRKGAAWFSSMGTDNSKGSKVFALTGKVNNTGLVEVPMGLSLRDIIMDIGGGVKDGKAFKAVQIGGPSGGCLPEELLDLPVDYDSLKKAGAMVGSGGLVVMDESTCMVDIARFFLNFTQKESCGKCTPCREGTLRMLEILEKIKAGQGQEEDLKKLERLAAVVKKTSLCGLGQTAPNPVLTTLRYFRSEYESHIREKRCPAGACTALLRYTILPERCVGCTLCARRCPTRCIEGKAKEAHRIDSIRCIKCAACLESCKYKAIVRV